LSAWVPPFIPGTLAVDVEQIAAACINVVHHPLHDEVDGALLPAKDEFIIVINSNQPINRRRFTLAHELGHFHLHLPKHIKTPGFCSISRAYKSYDTVEIEANQYAANLLMPEWLIRSVTTECEWNLSMLSEYFMVSQRAMSIRLGTLRIPIIS
jgi:Zn-dependent peptidase ImmA (M78 family)